MKKIIVILGILVVLGVGFLIYRNSASVQFDSASLFGTTGAVEENKTESEKKLKAQKIELYNRLPVNQDGFRIEYNIREEKYRVLLSPDYSQSKQKAVDWLEREGYGTFPGDAFEFILTKG